MCHSNAFHKVHLLLSSIEYRQKASKLFLSLAALLAKLSIKYNVKDTEEVNS